jgi:hypothetical protein
MSAGSCKFPIRGMAPPMFGQFLTERKLMGRRGHAIQSLLARIRDSSRQVAPLMELIGGVLGARM